MTLKGRNNVIVASTFEVTRRKKKLFFIQKMPIGNRHIVSIFFFFWENN